MIEEMLKHYSKETVIQVLTPFLTPERIDTIDRVLSHRIGSVQIAVERPCDSHNAFAMIRTAEALGILNIHFINPEIQKRRGKRTTRGTIKWVHLHRHPSLQAFDRARGSFRLAGASLDGQADFDSLPLDHPLCFIFGNESEGLSEEAKKRCDFLFRLPMFGMVESYNLSVAAALTLYDFLKRKRMLLQKTGDLTSKEILQEKAHYYIRSVGIEASNKMLERSLINLL